MFRFLLFIFLPLIEIALFLTIADLVGLGVTLLLIVAAAFIGFFVLQKQGLKAIEAVRSPTGSSPMTLRQIFDGLCIAVAGALLIIPGFFSDFLAILLLLPLTRARMRDRIGNYFAARFGFETNQSSVLEAEYEILPPDNDNNPQVPPPTDKNT